MNAAMFGDIGKPANAGNAETTLSTSEQPIKASRTPRSRICNRMRAVGMGPSYGGRDANATLCTTSRQIVIGRCRIDVEDRMSAINVVKGLLVGATRLTLASSQMRSSMVQYE